MPRQARLDAPGILHHVMVRGIEGCPIFRDDQARQDFVSRMGQLVEMTGTRVLAWTLMENHIHLLIISGPQGISKLMRRLLTGYAVRYNLRHRRSGHLFQNRYKSIACEEELRNGGQRREVSRLRAKISSHSSHEMGIPMAEIARHVGVCGSAVVKTLQKMAAD